MRISITIDKFDILDIKELTIQKLFTSSSDTTCQTHLLIMKFMMDQITNQKNNNSLFWTGKPGISIQIIFVLIPSIIFLKSGNLLLLGVLLGVCFSWLGLRLQQRNWTNVGLKRPVSYGRIAVTVIISTLVIIVLSYFLRQIITSLTNQKPNLEAFKAVEGNPKALLVGLLVVWVFGAFGEELFFRGFLINSFYKLLPDKYLNDSMKCKFSLLITSVITGIGHAYQGLTGMILTGIIGFLFGLIYLYSNRNLWPNILTHGLYDTVAFIMVFFGFNLDQIFR
jgi:membrane protease YdiL (CAAX protease family)